MWSGTRESLSQWSWRRIDTLLVTPPTPSWGSMSSDGLRNLFEHPSELFWPALCISLTVLAFNMLGDALRDALDVNVELAVDVESAP